MKYKYVGILAENIAEQCGISEHKNKSILVFDDRIEHVKERYLKDFGIDKEI